MKLVSAVILPRRLAAVHDALRTFGVLGLTVSEVLEQGRRPHQQVYRGQGFRVDLDPHIRLDIVAHDSDAADLVRIIVRVAGSHAGDGWAWVTPVDSMVRVRTGQRGVDAL